MGGEPRVDAYFLGIEGGGTRAVALLADRRGQILLRTETGPLNLQLSGDADVLRRLREINRHLPFPPTSLALCLAGCRIEADRSRVRALVERVWPRVSCLVGGDIDSALAAAFGPRGSGIVIISGTGSCVMGRNGGAVARAGGWGHLLGDHGSGYWIAMTGLRAAIREYDRHGRVSPKLRRALRRLCLNSPDELVGWAQGANKDAVAALAADMLEDDAGLMLQAASFLAQDCHAVAQKLQMEEPRVALVGGVLRHNRKLSILVGNRVRTMLPGAKVVTVRGETALGALKLAMGDRRARQHSNEHVQAPVLSSARPPETERRNPRTMNLDKRSVAQLVDTMLREEARVIPALRKNKRAIEQAIHGIVRAFKRGGRLFYVGAGTSGRLGVLDASECPPTFSSNPEMVQAIIAGGVTALHQAVEGAEDNREAGAEAVRVRGVGKRDVVVGIAASGTTPFVLGALDEAKRMGAGTLLLCFSPPKSSAHRLLLFHTGPEVITGSTRLKAGTATKLVLNMLTTISMIRMGKVVGNLMVDVRPTNAKLRARACRIVATLRGCDEEEAQRRLARCGWNVKKALR
ncbi:MAG TPA: N-acetylmuramic acid 6-phosphate etherase [Verrucomicrobiae bacterium]|nr:N-acetylmuramic acid 6-phosphate etherase [Verrucomicrobiae bacterium]